MRARLNLAGRAAWERRRAERERLAGRYAELVQRFRWWVVLVWVLATVASVAVVPSISQSSDDGIDGFVPAGSPAISAELRSFERFGFPLTGRVAIVQHDPEGLSTLRQAESLANAVAITQGEYDAGPVRGAIPLPNTRGLFSSTGQSDTTVITYLLIPPGPGFAAQRSAARQVVRDLFDADDAVVGVTGSIPARVEQAEVVEEALPALEAVTVLAVSVIVALTFRSLVAPLVTLMTAGIAFVATVRAASLAGAVLGVPIPSELEPLLVALLVGVVTDYVIFFLAAQRRNLVRGEAPAEASFRATREFTPIIIVAALTVAAGTFALLVAESGLFRAFGPGMGLSVLVAALVSVTLVPALMAVLGRAMFWPSRPGPARDERMQAGLLRRPEHRTLERLVVWMTGRRNAAVVLSGCVVVLLVAAIPAADIRLGISFVPSLPPGNEVRTAADAAKRGFSGGILSPTTLLLEGQGITADRSKLLELDRLLEQKPGVAGVFGAGEQILPQELDVVLSRDGDAARYLLVLKDEPLSADAVDSIESLQRDLPVLLDFVGLEDVSFGLAGDSAIAAEVVDRTESDLLRIAVAALVMNLLMLVLFLRALVAPVLLLASSVLGLLAALGVTTWWFQTVLGHGELTFYVPFAAAVLLVALGSDYNIFGVGHVWEEARRLPLRRAIITAVPASTKAITTAGVTLALTFGLLAIVPLRPFRELGMALSVGVLIDAVVIRSLVMPTMLALLGNASRWPAKPRPDGYDPSAAPALERL